MRRALALSCLMTLAGCYASDGLAPTAPITADLACPADALALAWGAEDESWGPVYHPASLAVAPGGALLARGSQFGTQVVRMRDGAAVAVSPIAPLDDRWRRSIEVDGDPATVTVRELATGDVVRAIERSPVDDGWTVHLFAVLSGAGDTAIVLQCASRAGVTEPRASVRAIDLASGAETRVELPGACGSVWAPGAPRLHAIEGGAIVLGMRAPGPEISDTGEWAPALGVARVDLATGSATLAFPVDRSTVAPVAGPFPHVGRSDTMTILAAAIADDELAIVARDGMLRRLDARTLEPIADPIAVPLFSANWETYLPSVESPVAYSEGGALLAHLIDESTIAVRSTETGAIVATLDLPFAALADGGVPPPMAMRFVHDGLLVTSSHGLARYACGGAVAEIARPAGELAVRAAGPASVRVGERITFQVDVENATLPVVRTIRIGAGHPTGAVARDVPAYPYELGSWDVEVTVDDGVREARATTRITVTE